MAGDCATAPQTGRAPLAETAYETPPSRATPKGTLVIDSMEFRVRSWDKHGKLVRAGRASFNVLAAMGYEGPKQEPVIWRLRPSVMRRRRTG
jgi:hypothetical protein